MSLPRLTYVVTYVGKVNEPHVLERFCWNDLDVKLLIRTNADGKDNDRWTDISVEAGLELIDADAHDTSEDGSF